MTTSRSNAWLRASCTCLLTFTIQHKLLFTQVLIPENQCQGACHHFIQLYCTNTHSCTPRLETYSWLRAASCPPCVPALSWLSPSTEDPSLAAGIMLSLCNHACSKKKIIAKSATQCQQKIICHGNSWFVKCKVHWMQLLTWAEKKESICRSSRRLPWNSSR